MKKITTREMAMCGIMAALMCIAGPLSVPVGPVPVTLMNLAIFFSIAVLHMRLTLISCVVYLLLGMAGLPVFSGFSGGAAKIAGPTGGYLIGYLFMILIGGVLYEHSQDRLLPGICGILVGLAVLYLFGTAWFVSQMKVSAGYALTVCVWPFIPFDVIKLLAAVPVGRMVRRTLFRAGFAEEL